MAEINQLTLSIKEKTLGSLVTNIKDVRAFVYERLKDYSAENYNGDAKKAKEDKAELNKVAEAFDERRRALKKEWDEPFSEFEQIITEISVKIKEVSGSLKQIVDEKETKEKEAKRVEIEKLWETKEFNLTTLSKIFNQKWLNKTYKINAISSDMDLIIKNINSDLEALDSFGNDTSTLKEFYLTTLDLQKTLTRGAEMKANRERLAEEKARREEAARKCEEEKAKAIKVDEEEPAKNPAPIEMKPAKKLPQEAVGNANGCINKKVYPFVITGDDLERVGEMAKGLGIKVFPALAMSGTGADIEAFKSLLAENELVYSKQAITHLVIRNDK